MDNALPPFSYTYHGKSAVKNQICEIINKPFPLFSRLEILIDFLFPNLIDAEIGEGVVEHVF